MIWVTHPQTVLAKVAGISILKRMALTMSRAGISEVLVVGPELAALRRDLECRHVARTGLKVDFADAARDEEALLASLGPDRPGPALVATGERIFELALMKRVLADGGRAVDRRGEELGLKVAGAGHTAAPVDVGNLFWRAVDTVDDRKQAERDLFGSLRKAVDGPVSRYINRYLSLAVSRRLVNTSITPNQMTLISSVFGIVGVWATLKATWASVAIGATLVQIQSVLDGCDGELARTKLMSSRFGEWLDNVLDDLINAAFGLALGVASASMFQDMTFQWLGIGAAVAIMIYNLVVYAQLALRHHTGNPFAFRWWFQKPGQDMPAAMRERESAGGVVTRALGFVYALARRDVFLFAFMLLSVARLPHVAVIWYSVLCFASFGMTIVHVVRGGMPSLPPGERSRGS